MSGDIVVDTLTRTSHPELAELVVRMCADKETQCIHSTINESPGVVCDEMAQLDDNGDLVYVAATQDGRIVGALGCEMDREVGRGWLRGPFAETPDRDALAGELFRALCDRLPDEIERLDTYLAVQHAWGNAFYASQGFDRITDVHVFEIERGRAPIVLAHPAETFAEEHGPGVIALHRALFPETFIDGPGLIASLDDSHALHVTTDGARVTGYIYTELDPHMEEGFLSFLGVDDAYRRQGLGTRLLATALDGVFGRTDMKTVSLTVDDRLGGARSLYEGVGFVLRYSGTNMRKVGTDLAG